jgi:hypothetical protein
VSICHAGAVSEEAANISRKDVKKEEKEYRKYSISSSSKK